MQTYEAMAYHVLQANFNHRIKTVSWWSLQKTVGAVLVTLRTLADPVREHLKEVYATMDDVTQGWVMEMSRS
jgi:mitochondrial distribution and morphology protein 31